MSSHAESRAGHGISITTPVGSAVTRRRSCPALDVEGNLRRIVPTLSAQLACIQQPQICMGLPTGWGLVTHSTGGTLRAGLWTPADHRAQREDEEDAVALAFELKRIDEVHETRLWQANFALVERYFGALGKKFVRWMRRKVSPHEEHEQRLLIDLHHTLQRMAIRRTKVIARAKKSSEAALTATEQPRGKNLMNSTTQTRRRGQ